MESVLRPPHLHEEVRGGLAALAASEALLAAEVSLNFSSSSLLSSLELSDARVFEP